MSCFGRSLLLGVCCALFEVCCVLLDAFCVLTIDADVVDCWLFLGVARVLCAVCC